MLTKRQEQILTAVIKEYTESASPVASNTLVKKYEFCLSPATIRTEMTRLEKIGFLYQPYTSAGRIPTDKGYRYFIDKLMEAYTLSCKDQNLIQRELLELKTKYNRLVKNTARILASLSDNLGLSSVLDLELFHGAGINKLIAEPEFTDSKDFAQMTETLDWFDENIERLFESLTTQAPQIYIGQENPLIKNLPTKKPNYSMVIAGFQFPSGEKGLVAIIGPKRMKYARNVSLVRYVTELLCGGAVVVIFVQLI